MTKNQSPPTFFKLLQIFRKCTLQHLENSVQTNKLKFCDKKQVFLFVIFF